MSTINIYSKTECAAVIPKGDDNVADYNYCLQDVELNGYYQYDAD
ncbi:hypothetical protein [Parvibaculum sp.]|nr:hypothetical protein [Parvibaculum sp.]